MSVIRVDGIKDIKVNTSLFYRKKGTTAYIYKREDEVLKVFRDTPRKNLIFHTRDMLSTLERLSRVKLDSFITPNDIYVDSKEEVLGYSMDNVKGTRTNRINSLLEIKTLLEYAEKLEEDNKELSDSKFKLLDLHEKNMYLTDDGYKLFDLDAGYFSDSETVERVYDHNRREITQTVIKGLLGIKAYHEIYIRDNDIMEAFCNDTVWEAIETINEKTGIKGINVKDVKRLYRGLVEYKDEYNPIRVYF